MKRYEYSCDFNYEKYKAREWNREHKAGGFRCGHCNHFVVINDMMGTTNRNHCNMCLWSKHVDDSKGDRRATCCAGMEPIDLTFKHEGHNRQGEIMLIHLCSKCQKISINRIARDDIERLILEVFDRSFGLSVASKRRLTKHGVYLLSEADRREVSVQLFGHY